MCTTGPLTSSDLIRQWLTTSVGELTVFRDRLNALNVFPVPDADTGNNALLTVTAGAKAAVDGTPSQAIRAMLFAAAGNSGTLLAGFFAGWLRAPEALVGQSPVAHRLAHAVAKAERSMVRPVPGTMLTVMAAAATAAHDDPAATEPGDQETAAHGDAARAAYGDAATAAHGDALSVPVVGGGPLMTQAEAVRFVRSVDAATAALLHTQHQLTELRQAQMVDSGAAAWLLIWRSLGVAMGLQLPVVSWHDWAADSRRLASPRPTDGLPGATQPATTDGMAAGADDKPSASSQQPTDHSAASGGGDQAGAAAGASGNGHQTTSAGDAHQAASSSSVQPETSSVEQVPTFTDARRDQSAHAESTSSQQSSAELNSVETGATGHAQPVVHSDEFEVLATFTGPDAAVAAARQVADKWGNSVVIVSDEDTHRLHVHSNQPAALEADLRAAVTVADFDCEPLYGHHLPADTPVTGDR